MTTIQKKKKVSAHFTHKYSPQKCTLLCFFVWLLLFIFFFLLSFFLSLSFLLSLSLSFLLSPPLSFSFLTENLFLWQSAIHPESLIKQSFQFLVSNKLIFVHAALLRKEGQFYAGFYGLQHKGIYLHASYLAATADYEIIYFSNRQLQWGTVKNYKLVYIVLFSPKQAALQIYVLFCGQITSAAHGVPSHLDLRIWSAFSLCV